MATPLRNRVISKLFRLCCGDHTDVFHGAVPCRTKHKVNIQKPWPGSIERQILVAVTKPIIPQKQEDPEKVCTRRSSLPSNLENVNAYENFLIGHQKKLIEEGENGIIAFCHMKSCDDKVYRKIEVALLKKSFKIHELNRKVFYHSVKDTKYETLNMILAPSTVMITSSTPNVAEYIQLVKRTPELLTLCAVVEGNLLSKTQVDEYITLPSKEAVLGEIVSLLNLPPQRLSSLLTSQQEQLVTNLKTLSEKEEK